MSENQSKSEMLFAKALRAYKGFVDRRVMKAVAGRSDECNPKRYPGLEILEKEWPAIRAEVDALLKNLETFTFYEDVDKRYAIQQGSERTKKKDEWRTEQFYLFGTPVRRGFERAPKTAELLRKIPGIQTALFSVLQPGAHIRAHCGDYKGVLRCHLGVKIPNPQSCRLRVVDQMHHWEEGAIHLFDHTLEHEAWNDSNDIRVVLLLDIVRKLPFPLSVLNKIGLKLIQKSKSMHKILEILERSGPPMKEQRDRSRTG